MTIDDAQLAAFCEHGYQDSYDHGENHIEFDDVTIAYEAARYYPAVGDIEAVGFTIADYFVLNMRGTEATSNMWDSPREWGGFWNNLWDIVRDLRVFPWRTQFGWGHAGFCRGARRWFEAYKDELPKDKKIFITGHSLGAQLSTWVAMHLRHAGFDVNGVVVFGEPKGFFPSAKRTYQQMGLKEITRSYLNNMDWIEDMPPWGVRSVVTTYSGIGGHSITDYRHNLAIRDYRNTGQSTT